jgi:hypothetical protein
MATQEASRTPRFPMPSLIEAISFLTASQFYHAILLSNWLQLISLVVTAFVRVRIDRVFIIRLGSSKFSKSNQFSSSMYWSQVNEIWLSKKENTSKNVCASNIFAFQILEQSKNRNCGGLFFFITPARRSCPDAPLPSHSKAKMSHSSERNPPLFDPPIASGPLGATIFHVFFVACGRENTLKCYSNHHTTILYR